MKKYALFFLLILYLNLSLCLPSTFARANANWTILFQPNVTLAMLTTLK